MIPRRFALRRLCQCLRRANKTCRATPAITPQMLAITSAKSAVRPGERACNVSSAAPNATSRIGTRRRDAVDGNAFKPIIARNAYAIRCSALSLSGTDGSVSSGDRDSAATVRTAAENIVRCTRCNRPSIPALAPMREDSLLGVEGAIAQMKPQQFNRARLCSGPRKAFSQKMISLFRRGQCREVNSPRNSYSALCNCEQSTSD